MSNRKPKQTTEIDHGVGSRIAFLRAANGLSQSALVKSAARIGQGAVGADSGLGADDAGPSGY